MLQNKLNSFIQRYSGPIYIYDLGDIEKRLQMLKRAFAAVKGFQHYFAMKSNSVSEILALMKDYGSGIDAVSAGEVELARASGFAAEKIIYSGVGKTRREIQRALIAGVGQFNVESLGEIKRISQIAQDLRMQVKVAIRVNPDVAAKTFSAVATGRASDKFGISFDQVEEGAKIAREEGLDLVGLSVHVGSMLMDFDALTVALNKTLELWHKVGRLKRFDFGGGLGIDYQTEGENDFEVLDQYARAVGGCLGGLALEEVQCEIGRWLVARAGILIAEIQDVKAAGNKTLIVLDTGMHHLMRPALYEAFHRIVVLDMDGSCQPTSLINPSGPAIGRNETNFEGMDFVGPVCESTDVLGRRRWVQNPTEGQKVAILDVGAYGEVMANRYNIKDEPQRGFIYAEKTRKI